jgi:mannose PTS system EIIA component
VTGIVIASHGPLAEGFKGAAEMILGPQQRLAAIGMNPAADIDALRAQIEAAVHRVLDAGGALVLVDLMGGSPSNASAYLAVAGTPVICGVNLPMLLEVLMARDSSDAAALAEQAVRAGRDNIVNLGNRLAEPLSVSA